MIDNALTEKTPGTNPVTDGPVLSPAPVPEGSVLYANLHGTASSESLGVTQDIPQSAMTDEMGRWSDQCAQWVRARPLTAVMSAFGVGLILGRARGWS